MATKTDTCSCGGHIIRDAQLSWCQECAKEFTICVHHWTIEPADGPQSQGICCRCHETRMFNNAIYSDTFNGKRSKQKQAE